MPTDLLFRADAYGRECSATIVAVSERGGIVLDKGLRGSTRKAAGSPATRAGSRSPRSRSSSPPRSMVGSTRASSCMCPRRAGGTPASGSAVTAKPRLGDAPCGACASALALHLLSCVLPYPVTGGAIGEGEGRLDFDIPDAGLDKEELTAKLQALVDRDGKSGSAGSRTRSCPPTRGS